MTEQSKVAVAEKAAKVLSKDLMDSVEQETKRRKVRHDCWSDREVIMRESKSVKAFQRDYWHYAHSMN